MENLRDVMKDKLSKMGLDNLYQWDAGMNEGMHLTVCERYTGM